MKTIELKPIKETTEDFEAIEKRIKRFFLKHLYIPILKELQIPKNKIQNAKDWLREAMNLGKITYSRGAFRGKFNASTSKELIKLGAKWDKKTNSFKVPFINLKPEMQEAIRISELRFSEKLHGIDRKIAQLLPIEVLDQFNVSDLFDKMLFRVETNFQKTIHNITVAPQLTSIQRAKIAIEWQNNMDIWIKEFSEKQIIKLRQTVMQSTFAGNRYESLVKGIQESYDVTANKAKFLARQETNLLLAKFKEVRYTDAGVNEYKWTTVKMPHDTSPNEHVLGNVRYYHGLLDGTVQRWDNPPMVSRDPLEFRNPGQDYNCRCYAIPIVKFSE